MGEKRALWQFLGLYQLLAGSIGLGAAIQHVPQFIARLPPGVHGQAILLFAGAAVAFGFIAVTGLFLLRGKPIGWRLSLVSQFVQVISWSSTSTKYSLIAGVYAALRWSSPGIEPVVGATTSFQLGWSGPLADQFFAINVVPLIVIVLLLFGRSPRRPAKPSASA